jgi:hypothetical protein
MNKNLTFRTAVFALAVAGLGTAHAATMTKSEFHTTEERIEANYKSERKACQPLKGNTQDVCEKQAKAKQKVARAQLQADYSGELSDQTKLRLVKADTAYDVAQEMCDDKAGNAKDLCIKEAKAVQAKSRADTKMNEKISDAQMDANQNKRDADYKVAAEKCDALAGDVKSTCIAAAKTQFGKN